MRIIVNLILSCCCFLAISFTIHAESWRGITPLRSTKTDVERLLGKPTETTDKLLTYRLPSESVFIYLITTETKSADLKRLRLGTVDSIQVMPRDTVYLSDLGLDEKKIVFTKGSKPEYAGFVGYIDQDAGLIVQMVGRRVDIIFYFANTKDRMRCPSCAIDPQTIANIPICVLCPTVAVTCRDSAEAGVAITFTGLVAGSGSEPTYHWTVNAGTITKGQGTSSIEVDTKNLAGKTITATVEVGGMDPACSRKASCDTPILPKQN